MKCIEVNGYSNYLLYSDGRIKNKTTGRYLKPYTDSVGYKSVALTKDKKVRYFRMHRLMAIHFINNPHNYPEVNHIDGVRTNYSLNNLEWCTRSMNEKHASIFLGKKRIPPSPETNYKKIARSDGVIYNSLKEAALINKCSVSGISMALLGYNKTCKGYKWKYV